MRLPKPTPLGWCAAAAGIAVIVGTIGFVALHNPIVAGALAVLGGAAFVLAGPRPAPSDAAAAPQQQPAVVPAPRGEVAEPQPVAMAAAPVMTAAPVMAPAPALPVMASEPVMAPPVAAAPALPADPLDQVSLLSAYLQDETGGYQPSYAPEAPTLVARVPGQTLTVTEPDPLADAFSSPAPDGNDTEFPPAGAWRIGVDILPQSRSSAVAVGDRLASFRSAVLKARHEAKREIKRETRREAKPKSPKPPPGKHRAG